MGPKATSRDFPTERELTCFERDFEIFSWFSIISLKALSVSLEEEDLVVSMESERSLSFVVFSCNLELLIGFSIESFNSFSLLSIDSSDSCLFESWEINSSISFMGNKNLGIKDSYHAVFLSSSLIGSSGILGTALLMERKR